MSENVRQIAQRIKALREDAGIPVETLAARFGIAPDTYRAYETGLADIPVSLLYEIATAFKVELTAILTGEEPRLTHYSLVRAGQGISVERRKEYRYQDLAYNFAHKKAEVFEVTVSPRPGEARPQSYRHPGQEFAYVLEGTLTVHFGGQRVTLNAGDSLYFNSGLDHAMVAENGSPARFLAIIL